VNIVTAKLEYVLHSVCSKHFGINNTSSGSFSAISRYIASFFVALELHLFVGEKLC